MLCRTFHVRQIKLLSPVVYQADEQVDVADDGAGGGLDIMGDGQHQLFTGNQQVLGIRLRFFQFPSVMVVAGDVACNDNGEYQYQYKGGNGNLGHGFRGLFPYLFLLHQFGAGGFLFIVLNVFQQLVDTLAQPASNDAQAADASVQHLGFLLTGLEYLVLNTCNHTADGINRAVYFIQCIRVFFLNYVAHLGGIFFSWCEYVSQSLEESFLLVMDSVGVMVRNDFSAYVRRTEQRILLSYQAVELFLIDLVGRRIPHGFQHRIHVPLLVL